MKKTSVFLKSFLYASVAVSLLLLAAKELGWMGTETWQLSVKTEFYVNITLELLTLCNIPLALRLFKWRAISAQLYANKEKALLKWGSIRMALLCVPMVANTLFYTFTGKAAYFYMAVILFICLAFVYPSMARCVAEVTPQENK